MEQGSMSDFEKTGVLTDKDLMLPSEAQLKKGVAIAECVQNIPCNPCVDSCPVHAISMKDINAPPVVDYDACIACGKCVGVCPGLAIFVIKKTDNRAFVTVPYEFLPVPKKDDIVDALDRSGSPLEKGTVKRIRKQGRTYVITIEITKENAMSVRNIRV
jgi:Fe-S-cluster-containing hydrogenase component 2